MIETERLLLRRWREEDREPFARMNADPAVMEYFPAPLTRGESDALMNRCSGAIEVRGWGLWAAELRGEKRFIGLIGLSAPAFHAHFTPCVEIGWRLSRDAWGQGLATEGARAALRYGFEQIGLSEVISFTSEGNLRSRRVMEKIGMNRNPADDFDHPHLIPGHRLRRHVLYRIGQSKYLADRSLTEAAQ
jgi:ribosomal-protein-alanine N-acetyltransferase